MTSIICFKITWKWRVSRNMCETKSDCDLVMKKHIYCNSLFFFNDWNFYNENSKNKTPKTIPFSPALEKVAKVVDQSLPVNTW